MHTSFGIGVASGEFATTLVISVMLPNAVLGLRIRRSLVHAGGKVRVNLEDISNPQVVSVLSLPFFLVFNTEGVSASYKYTSRPHPSLE
jgi:hypothetical protein